VSRKSKMTEDDFGDILRNGLSTTRTYVVLKQKSRSPVFLQFRPFVTRCNSVAVYIGGKLSAFLDSGHEKVKGVYGAERIAMLKAAWKKLPQDRVGDVRVGSNAGFYVITGKGDKSNFLSKFDKGHLIAKMLTGIEEELGIEIDNRADVTAYLSWFYAQHLEGLFEGRAKLPERSVGKKTDLLLGQKYAYQSYNQSELKDLIEKVGLEDKLSEAA